MKLPFFHKKPVALLTPEENEQVVNAIRTAESRTSGEVRVFMENHCSYVNPVDRAGEIFFGLKMEKTVDRNAVLLYFAVKDHQFAIFGDEGIYLKTGAAFWQQLVKEVSGHFRQSEFVEGIVEGIIHLGEELHTHFPFDRASDQNELPDAIVFGN